MAVEYTQQTIDEIAEALRRGDLKYEDLEVSNPFVQAAIQSIGDEFIIKFTYKAFLVTAENSDQKAVTIKGFDKLKGILDGYLARFNKSEIILSEPQAIVFKEDREVADDTISQDEMLDDRRTSFLANVREIKLDPIEFLRKYILVSAKGENISARGEMKPGVHTIRNALSSILSIIDLYFLTLRNFQKVPTEAEAQSMNEFLNYVRVNFLSAIDTVPFEVENQKDVFDIHGTHSYLVKQFNTEFHESMEETFKGIYSPINLGANEA